MLLTKEGEKGWRNKDVRHSLKYLGKISTKKLNGIYNNIIEIKNKDGSKI